MEQLTQIQTKSDSSLGGLLNFMKSTFIVQYTFVWSLNERQEAMDVLQAMNAVMADVKLIILGLVNGKPKLAKFEHQQLAID